MSRRSLRLGFALTWGIGLFALASWTAPHPTRQEDRGSLRGRLGRTLDAATAGQVFPSLSAGVWLGDEVVFSRWSARNATTAAEALDNARSAPWVLESLSAIALLRMADAGKLELSDPLTKHLPQLGFGGNAVTVSQVLTHTSGAPSYVDHAATTGVDLTSAAVLSWLAERPLDSDPGSCFAYSESNALIAAALVEKLGEKPIEKALAAWVLEPAHLSNSGLEMGSASRRTREASFSVRGAPVDAASVGRLFGCGDVHTTLDDLSRLMRGLEGQLLTDSSRKLLLAADRLPGGIEAPYAYGFARSRIEQSACLSLRGASSAGAVHVAWTPESSLVVALASRAAPAELSRLSDELVRAVFEIAEQRVVDLPLTKEQCAIYAGVYYMGCTRTTVEAREEQLFFESPFEGPYRLRFQGGQRFVAATDEQIVFEFKVDSGVATEFVISHHGSRTGAVRLK